MSNVSIILLSGGVQVKNLLTISILLSIGYLQGSIQFTAYDIATSADGTYGVYVADMDGDGDLDIVSASFGDDTIAWYENNGAADPSFAAQDIATSADGAASVFAADMDGDGDLDIVSASFIDNTIAWYENDGAANPTWTAVDIATSADGAESVFAADMDGDGDLDIVSASFNDDTIAWYENDGAADPSWTAADIDTNVDGPKCVYAADMDGDGDMDIVSAIRYDNMIAWYENDGAADPTWTAVEIATNADGAWSVFAADMDGDGDMDIVSGSYYDDTIAWYEQEGSPELAGCTDGTACNYDADSTVDDGSCSYAQENYDCDGNCTASEDCAGDCGGSAVVDECGVCSGDNSSCLDCCSVPNGDNSTCGSSGDVNGGGVDVTDLVAIVAVIVEFDSFDSCQINEADINSDGVINIFDVVMLLNLIFWDSLSRGELVTSSTLYFGNGTVSYEADGNVAGIQLEVSGEFIITNSHLPAGWEMANNSKTIILFNQDTRKFTLNKEFNNSVYEFY